MDRYSINKNGRDLPRAIAARGAQGDFDEGLERLAEQSPRGIYCLEIVSCLAVVVGLSLIVASFVLQSYVRLYCKRISQLENTLSLLARSLKRLDGREEVKVSGRRRNLFSSPLLR